MTGSHSHVPAVTLYPELVRPPLLSWPQRLALIATLACLAAALLLQIWVRFSQ